ncbi:MAG: pentapeptide repeat-containing protein [Microlunatus sp.]|nr:pentapeptide repeat-containing protein [Microlunatus sp.]
MPPPPITQPPKIPSRKPVPRNPSDGSTLLDGDSYAGQLYDRVDLAGRDLRHSTFSECAFLGCDLTGTDLTGTHLVESDLSEVEAAQLSGPRSLWRGSVVSRSRLGAIEWYEATLDGLVVEDTKISYLNARSSTWKDVLLRRCVIDELDLVEAQLTRVRFQECQIRTLELSRTRCREVDLRSAELREVSGLAGLAGCTISPEQLTELSEALAAHLGFRVADLDPD